MVGPQPAVAEKSTHYSQQLALVERQAHRGQSVDNLHGVKGHVHVKKGSKVAEVRGNEVKGWWRRKGLR